jgi:photosystem II stability/assembly factor-like uncharacterized protein
VALAAQEPQIAEQVSGTTARLQAVSVVTSQVVWASGARGTWVRTLDGGEAWMAGVVPGAESLEFRDVHAASADTAWLLSAGPGDRSRIYFTADGGKTWALQFTNAEPRAFFDCIAFWDARRGLAVSDAVDGRFIVLSTTDGGTTWGRVADEALPPAVEGEGMFAASGTCLMTHGTHHAWFGTGAGKTARVIRTTDGGNTWVAAGTPIVQNTATAGIMSLVFFDDTNGLALGGDLVITGGPTNNVAATADGGRTWVLVGRPTFSGAVYGAAAVPGRGESVVAVGPGGSSWSPDGGRTWRPLPQPPGGYWSIGSSLGGTIWMVGPRGRITRVRFP